MPKRFFKHKILLDENMPSRLLLERLNQHFDVKHIRDDIRHGQIDDPDVYQLAVSQGRIVVTFNGSDFRPLVGTLDGHEPGVIDVPAGWAAASIDTKLTALLMRHGPKYFAGHYRTLATE
jgi:predicted nuclease of predicted toxin-antitoxin system